MGRSWTLVGVLALSGAPALAQTSCEPQAGDLFTRACLEERERLANEALVGRLTALCDDVGWQMTLAGRGSSAWSMTDEGGRCEVSFASGGGGVPGGSGATLSNLLGGSVVVGGGGSTSMELPPGFEDFIEDQGLVVLEQEAFAATLEGLQLMGRAEEAGIPPQILDLQGIEDWTMAPDAWAEDAPGAGRALDVEGIDPAIMDPGALGMGPGEGGG